MKMCPVGRELFCADGRTDMTNIIVTLRNFANVPKKTNCNTLCCTLFAIFIECQYILLH
jgi:hypothetical protein